MSERSPTIKARIFRCNPGEGQRAGSYAVFDVPLREKMSVLNVLQYVNEHYDGGLAYYVSCRRGLCSGCGVRVNGKAKLACVELVSGDLTIEPLSEDRVVKDLLVHDSDRND